MKKTKYRKSQKSMEKSRRFRETIPFPVIELAIAGDAEAVDQVLAYFQPYINSICRRPYLDDYGVKHYGIDEYMKRQMETKLITKILDFEIRV